MIKDWKPSTLYLHLLLYIRNVENGNNHEVKNKNNEKSCLEICLETSQVGQVVKRLSVPRLCSVGRLKRHDWWFATAKDHVQKRMRETLKKKKTCISGMSYLLQIS